MRLVVPDQEILQGVAATLRWTNVNGDGVPVEAGGAVTAVVKTSDGTTLTSGTATAATSVDGVPYYTFGLTAAQTEDLELLTVTWTDAGDSSVHTTKVEIVGGLLVTVAQVRAAHKSLATRSDDELRDATRNAVREVEWICDRSFRPRFRRVLLDGDGTPQLWVPDNDLIAVSECSIDGTALSAAQLAELVVFDDRRVDRDDGDVWPFGRSNVEIVYTYGLDAPDPLLAGAVMTRVRHMVNAEKSGIPDRATSISVDGYGPVEVDRASRYRVGVPEVDAVYSRWSKRGDGESGVGAVSMALDYDPQHDSLFHGERA